MEVSVFGGSRIGRIDLCCRESRLCFPKIYTCERRILSRKTDDRLWFGQSARWRKAGLRLALRAVQSEPVRSDRVSLRTSTKPRSLDRVRLFVGLPLDSVSECSTVNHARAIAVGLKALKLLGVEGVELPVWWGIAEKEAMGKYDWSGYLLIADMVQKAGLKLHITLCFHASSQPKISLPDWVSRIGDSQPGIYFKDRSGQYYKECLSLAVDNLPVLDGKTPIQVYQDFCENFKSAFSSFMGSTITGISMGLGPEGELQYPSLRRLSKSRKLLGAGEFQCYDQNMLGLLKQHAEANGTPLWGLGGPHDAPRYEESPNLNNFFKDNGGSWGSPYGDFFLSWYSSLLLSHGDRLLSLASSTFSEKAVEVYGKVPLLYSWYKTQSHPSELTAGFYNTNNKDGYEEVAEIFAKYSCKMIVPGMDLSDDHQPQESLSSPELLVAQIRRACRKHGVRISGQNSSVAGVPGSFEQIKKNLSDEDVVDLFTYQRMGAFFFSPEHFPSFTEFVRSLNQPAWHSDDLPFEGELENAELSSTASSESEEIQMQVA